MATYTFTNWKTAAGGSWTGASNWDNGVPGTSSSIADLDTLATAYTVTLTSNVTIGFLRVDQGAALTVTGAKLSITDAVNPWSNIELAGTVSIGAGGTISLASRPTSKPTPARSADTGVLNVASTGAAATLSFADSWSGLGRERKSRCRARPGSWDRRRRRPISRTSTARSSAPASSATAPAPRAAMV